MELTFLGTGAAWGLPELNCKCFICQEMRKREEKRDRTSLLLSGESTLLVDCGPDCRAQLSRNCVDKIDAVLVSHEHGDHFIGLDELFAYKRNLPREDFRPIEVYLTAETRQMIAPRFGYLEELGVVKNVEIRPYEWFHAGEFMIFPFSTDHGNFAKGSVGFLITFQDQNREEVRVVYTSDFKDIPALHREILRPDYLIIQSFWLNEPVKNRPHHMSFQRAIQYIGKINPKKRVFLVHMGDADMVRGDPANRNAKKYEARDPLRSPGGGEVYPVPLNQEEWQDTVDRIIGDRGIQYKITVACDDLRINI